jgi:hypothetical protein
MFAARVEPRTAIAATAESPASAFNLLFFGVLFLRDVYSGSILSISIALPFSFEE